MESVFSKRIRAGKRRTYFFDVRATRGNDYYITITESRKKFNEDGYDRHKIFLYKEDFNKFIKALTETVDYVKTDLMPDFDFDAFNHDTLPEGEHVTGEHVVHENVASENNGVEEKEEEIVHVPEKEIEVPPVVTNTNASATEEADKW